MLERILGIQKIVLGHCLSAATLARLAKPAAPVDPGSDPLRMEEVFRSLTDGIWSDLDKLPAAADAKDQDGQARLSTIRRNLQREYLAQAEQHGAGHRSSSLGDSFSYIVFIGGGNTAVPADARALARLHLKEIGSRLGTRAGNARTPILTTRRGPTSKSAGTGSPRFWRPISTSGSPDSPKASDFPGRRPDPRGQRCTGAG